MPRGTVRSNGEAIYAFRSRYGITQEDLAARSGYSKRTIERLEAGTDTTLLTLSNVASVLKCQTDDLVQINDVGTTITTRLDGLIKQKQENIEELIERKRMADSARRAAVLARFVCPPEESGATSIVCRTKSLGDLSLTLKSTVTMAELAEAIAKAYFQNEYADHDWTICDSGKSMYEPATTVADLHERSVNLIYICKRKRVSPGFAATPIPPFCLKTEVSRFRKGGYILKRLWCRIYSWICNLPGFSNVIPSEWALKRLNEVVTLYSETNVRIEDAVGLSNIMERTAMSVPAWWYYRDTIAWVWYRTGNQKSALATLTHDLPNDAMENLGVLYHLYFILKGVGATSGAAVIRKGFDVHLREKRVSGSWNPDYVYELECKRIYADDDLLMPE